MKQKVVIIGGRGNGTVIASTIEDCQKSRQDIECVGFLNDNEQEINEYPVIGGIKDKSWKTLPDDYFFIYAMSNVKQSPDRFQMLKDLEIPEDRFATIIHPTAVVSGQAKIGRGVVLMPLTLVSPNVVLGNHTQLYAQSFIGHDTLIDEMVFVANNVSIGGRVHIKNGAHIGSNSSILERVEIGRFAVIGLGSVVLQDVREKEKIVGNPGRSIGFLSC